MPTFASGLSGQLVVATESTYGTRVAPDHALECNTEGLALTLQRLSPSGIRAGQQFASGSRSVQTTRDVNGDIVLEVPNKGYGVLLNQMHGNTVTPTRLIPSTGLAYSQTHAIGLTDPFAKSLTVQAGIPDTTATVRPIEFVGCKVLSTTYAVDVGGYLVATHTIDGRNMDSTQTLVTPTYASGTQGFDFTQGSVLIDGSPVANVTAASITIGQPMKTDRFFLNTTGLKGQPIVNAFGTLTATLSAEFQSMVDVTRFVNNTSFALDLKFENPTVIETTNKYTFQIHVPLMKADGPSPILDGPDVVNMDIAAIGFSDGTNAPVTITYISTDATI